VAARAAAAATFAMPPRRKHWGKGRFGKNRGGYYFVNLRKVNAGLVSSLKKDAG
jgi:hypothetical protein